MKPNLFSEMPKRKVGGGYRQQLAKEKEAQEKQPSKLAEQLLEKWSWGHISAPLVQTLAAAAVEDGLTQTELVRMANIGGGGKYAGNTHRDLMLFLGKPTLEQALSEVSVRLKVSEEVSADKDLKFLMPHKLFAALYHSMPEAFLKSVLGGSEDKAGRFWTQMKDHPNVKARPAPESKRPSQGDAFGHPRRWSGLYAAQQSRREKLRGLELG